MMGGGGMGCGMMGVGMLLAALFFLAVLVAGIVLIVRAFGDRSAPSQRPEPSGSALALLEERYARGEIDHEEFEQRRRTLRTQA